METGAIIERPASPAAATADTTAAETTTVETKEAELSSLTDAERLEWRKTGELPQREVKPKKDSTQADSSTAKKEPSEADKTAESAPASEAGKEQKPKRDNAESRIKELLAENKRLSSENERLSKQPAPKTEPADSSTAKPEAAKAPEPPKRPVRPKLEDFDTLEKYQAAMDKYDEELDTYHDQRSKFNTENAIREARQKEQLEARQREFNKSLAEAAQKYPNLKEVLPPFTKELESAHPYVQHVLNSTPDNLLPEILMVICGDEETKEAFLAEAKSKDPTAAVERIAVTKSLVRAELSKAKDSPKEAPKEQPRAEDGKFQKAPENKVTKAPPPAPEVPGKSSPPTDEADDALKSGNVRAYMDAENARALREKRRY